MSALYYHPKWWWLWVYAMFRVRPWDSDASMDIMGLHPVARESEINVHFPKSCVACKKPCGLHMTSVVTAVDAESDIGCHLHYKSGSGDIAQLHVTNEKEGHTTHSELKTTQCVSSSDGVWTQTFLPSYGPFALKVKTLIQSIMTDQTQSDQIAGYLHCPISLLIFKFHWKKY